MRVFFYKNSIFIYKNKDCIYRAFKSAQRLGLSLEMLFRAADVECKGCVYVEEFRIFLNKLKLGLTQAEINKILHMFDEEWTGSIKRDDYLLCLAAYGVNSEKPNDKVRNLSQESLMKFARILIDKRFSSEDAFKTIDVKKSGSFTPEQLSEFYKKQMPGVSKKERAALFFTMDLEQRGKIEKSNFIDLIEKATKVLNDRMNDTDRGFSGNGSLTSTFDKGSNVPNNDKGKFLSIVDKFEKKINGPFTKLLESLVLGNKNPETGINFKHVQETIGTFGDFFSYEEKFIIFKNLDVNKNGNICFEDLVETFVEFKKKDSNYEFFIMNFAKNLQALHIQTEAYLSENGIGADSKMDSEEFCTKISGLINLYKEDTKRLFETIVKSKKKNIFGYELINLLNSYRFDVDAKNIAKPTKKDEMLEEEEIQKGDERMGFMDEFTHSKTNLSKTKTLKENPTLTKTMTKTQMKQFDEDDKKFNKLIEILKPKFEKDDHFELDGKKMDTIFNNYLSCLKK